MKSISLSMPFICFSSVTKNYPTNFKEPGTSVMETLIDLHHDIFALLLIVLVFVLWMLTSIIIYFRYSPVNSVKNSFSTMSHSSAKYLEFIWTLVPAILLALMIYPSFIFLYGVNEPSETPHLTMHVRGSQWYWHYTAADKALTPYYLLTDPKLISDGLVDFDSYMIEEEDLKFGSFRLLETDNRLILPSNRMVRFLITSNDVMHSWAIPSLGVKVDAMPGRLNEVWLNLKYPGTLYYGQCSEMRGLRHSFMPIVMTSK